MRIPSIDLSQYGGLEIDQLTSTLKPKLLKMEKEIESRIVQGLEQILTYLMGRDGFQSPTCIQICLEQFTETNLTRINPSKRPP
jgi:hypothetical protein